MPSTIQFYVCQTVGLETSDRRKTSVLQTLCFFRKRMMFYIFFYFCFLRKRPDSDSSCDCCFHFHNLQTPGIIGAPAPSEAGLSGVTCCSLILLLDSRFFEMGDTVCTRGGSFKCGDLWQPCWVRAATRGAMRDPASLFSS